MKKTKNMLLAMIVAAGMMGCTKTELPTPTTAKTKTGNSMIIANVAGDSVTSFCYTINGGGKNYFKNYVMKIGGRASTWETRDTISVNKGDVIVVTAVETAKNSMSLDAGVVSFSGSFTDSVRVVSTVSAYSLSLTYKL